MPWQTLTAGALNATASVPGIDPNLVWADATGFIDFIRPVNDELPGPPPLVPVIIELRSQTGALETLRKEVLLSGGSVPTVYRSKSGEAIRYCTAMVPPTLVKQWLASMKAGAKGSESPVARFDLQMPLVPQRPRIEAPIATSIGEARAQVSEKRLLIGVIDSGCPFAHHQFRDRSGPGTRVLGLWDQNENSGFARVGGYRPRDLGYGCEITQASLNALIARCSPGGVVCEDTCYSAAGYREVSRRMAHGAAVLGLFAGDVPLTLGAPIDPDEVPRWTALEGEPVRDADIAFVQLPRAAVQDSSSAGLPRLLLDGIRYILSLAGEKTEHVIINLSEGSSRGTHDGASIFEEALRELAALDTRLKVVIAAGNTYDEQRHAVLGGTGAAPGPVTFRLPPGCESGAAVVVRMPNGDGYALRVTAPGDEEKRSS